jgi:hypothetical protein
MTGLRDAEKSNYRWVSESLRLVLSSEAGATAGMTVAPWGWVPLMKASSMPLSSLTNTMLPGA